MALTPPCHQLPPTTDPGEPSPSVPTGPGGVIPKGPWKPEVPLTGEEAEALEQGCAREVMSRGEEPHKVLRPWPWTGAVPSTHRDLEGRGA